MNLKSLIFQSKGLAAIPVVLVLGTGVALWFRTGRMGSQQRPSLSPLEARVEVPEDPGYLPYPVEFMQRSTEEALTFDPSLGKPAAISYKLTRAGRVRIRVVWRADPHLVLRTLLDWTDQEFGNHTVLWDGRDASGNIVDNRRCSITFEEHGERHTHHDPGRCREMSVTITSPDHPGVLLRDLSEIQVALVTGGYDPARPYQVRGYIDYVFAFGIHVQPGGKTFHLPPIREVAPGEHLITLNIDDGYDHMGIAGVRVYLQP